MISAWSQVIASTPGGEPESPPHDLLRYTQVAYDGCPVYLQIHRREMISQMILIHALRVSDSYQNIASEILNESKLCYRKGAETRYRMRVPHGMNYDH